MKFSIRHSFPHAQADVLRMLGDHSYYERKYLALGYRDIQVMAHELSDGCFRIKVRYTSASAVSLPAFARKLIGDTSTVTQEDIWDLGTGQGRITLDIHGLPARVSCTMQMAGEATGCFNTMDWEVAVAIPLIGGKIEQIIAEDIQLKSGKDEQVVRQLLAQDGLE